MSSLLEALRNTCARHRTRLCGTALAVLVLSAASLAAAPFGVSDERAAELVAELENRFEVLSWSGGHVLEPRRGAAYEIVEIEDRALVIDGERYRLESDASREVVRELLGDDFVLLAELAGFEIEPTTTESDTPEEPAASPAEPADRSEEAGLDRREPRRERRDVSRRRDDGSRVSLFSDLEIRPNEVAREAVVVMGSLEARGDVLGDATVVLGSAEVDGYIDGDLTVVGGSISIGPHAVIEGDVTSVGGSVRRASGARVDGEIFELSMAPVPDFDFLDFDDLWPFGHGWGYHYRSRGLDLIGLVFNFAALAVLVILASALARRRVGRVAAQARAEPFKAGFVGFLIEVLIGPVMVVLVLLLVISIIGIPVLILFLPLALLGFVVVLFLGFAGVAQAIGETLTGRGPSPGGRRAAASYAAVLLGLLLIQIWQIFGEAMSLLPGPIQVFAALMIALGFLIKYIAWTVGLGAFVLERFAPSAPPPPSLTG